MKKLLRIIWILIVLIAAFFVVKAQTTRFGSTQKATTTLANPASVYCQQQSGTLEIVTDLSGWQSGICHLTDGTTCDEWAYFRGECPTTGISSGENSWFLTYTDNVYGIQLQYPDTWEIYQWQPPFELPLLTWMRFQDKTWDGIIRVAISIYSWTYSSFVDFQSWYKASIKDTMTSAPIQIKIAGLDAIETMQTDGIDSVSPYIYISKGNNTVVFTTTNGSEGKKLLLDTLDSLKFTD